MDALPFVLPAPRTTLVWQDDFTGAAGSAPSSANWHVEEGYGLWGGTEEQAYTGRTTNIQQDGESNLKIVAREESFNGHSYTSARIQAKVNSEQATANALQSFQYGRIEARIKVPSGSGLWPAFWMVGANKEAWPAVGEIDIMEMYGATNKNGATIHAGPEPQWQNGVTVPAAYIGAAQLTGAFHNYGLIWEPNLIAFTLDGFCYTHKTSTVTPSGKTWPFNAPFYFIINLAVGGSSEHPPEAASFPATMLVDWVRVYQ
jgi:beta-glucanase (GH16 family)